MLLKRWRARAGFTQSECAESLGVTQATWSGYESGRQEPSLTKGLEIETLTGGAVAVGTWVLSADAAGPDPADDEAPESSPTPVPGKEGAA